ncbi:MAG: hypothetical protein ACRDZX_08855 [Acidimicrobiales bacterium]
MRGYAPTSGVGEAPPAEAGDGLLEMAAAFGEALAGFEPERMTAHDCAEVAEALARTEKACAAARARAAARAVRSGEHRRRGFADGRDWLASHSGATSGQARSEMQAAEAAEEHPATSGALHRGEVSLAQAAEVARAVSEVPGSEGALLALARRSGLGAVREEARKVVSGVADPDELYARQHAARHLRHWRDAEGMVRFAGALPPEVGIGVMASIDALAHRLRREAKAEGRSEPFEACAADALVELVQGRSGGAGKPLAVVNVVCDLSAYRRGHAHPGEPCHIVGGGPVPVRWVREAMADAFVKAVVHDGVRVRNVAHLGRHMNAELRTALELGPVPGFDGVKCSHPGCERRYGLEWDHVQAVSRGGPPATVTSRSCVSRTTGKRPSVTAKPGPASPVRPERGTLAPRRSSCERLVPERPVSPAPRV